MDKICTKCKFTFPKDSFPVLNKDTGKRHAMCSECKKEYDREYYAKNKNLHRKNENQKLLRKRNRNYIVNYLKQNPCKDCGEDDFIVLEFDHLKDKDFNLADAGRSGYSLERIKKEIAKCDVVCANCHRRRTAKQFNYYK